MNGRNEMTTKQTDAMLAALERVADMFKQECDPSVQGIACDVFNALAQAKGE